MIDTNTFGKILYDMGFVDFSGVPCSYLAPLINYAINENRFIMANNEGDAIAIASGISLAMGLDSSKAQFGVALMQNSGLSNALSPLTSLNDTFGIPILGFVSLRGERKNGINTDEPQHELLGVITDKLLQTCNIQYEFLDSDIHIAQSQLHRAKEILKTRKSFFFIIKDKTFSSIALESSPNIPTRDSALIRPFDTSHAQIPTRLQALETIHHLAHSHNALLLATTGKSGRELYEIADTPNQLYMVGSMGCVSSLGLGITLKSSKKLIAIDGDSALLMRLGALSTNAYYAKMHDMGNFCHILLDNYSHDSTGGQFNLSPFVDFPTIASACGYEIVEVVNNLESLSSALKAFLDSRNGGARFIYLRIAKGSKPHLGRPKITPKEVALRLAKYIHN